MKEFEFKKQQTGAFWLDETNAKIPANRLTKVEKMMEYSATKVVNDAIKLNKQMVSFKSKINTICNDVYRNFLRDKNIEITGRKGNFTWYNFDRSIKIEVDVHETITFDDMTITAAREKLDMFIEQNVEGKIDFIKELVNDSFKTSRGKLDAKKVLSLIRYRSKIKDELFNEALTLIEDSIRRPASRTYYRVFVKDETGKYQSVELNLSNI